jgi:hypothetical protein
LKIDLLSSVIDMGYFEDGAGARGGDLVAHARHDRLWCGFGGVLAGFRHVHASVTPQYLGDLDVKKLVILDNRPSRLAASSAASSFILRL